MKQITVIDYGIGNLLSVVRAFEYHGVTVKVTDAAAEIEDADALVLPGVGAFGDGMQSLRQRRLIEPLLNYFSKERPFLGICLGMQMMLQTSEEFGDQQGLGIIAGDVRRIPDTGSDGMPHKIPHIGWNELTAPDGISWDNTILQGVRQGSAVYFVHSYAALPTRPDDRLADCHYNGCVIAAAIRKGPLYGCQFHPEKSGTVGLRIISNFINLA